jgi:hypothetical protein
MHVSIGRYTGVGVAVGDVIETARHLTAALSGAPGFISYALLDMGDGALASICVFESRSELDAGEHLIGRWMADHLPSRADAPAAYETGEIVLQRGM